MMKGMVKLSNRYTEDEREILDWITSKISHPDEMRAITPVLSRILNRTDIAIRHQIEDRKKMQGEKGWIMPR